VFFLVVSGALCRVKWEWRLAVDGSRLSVVVGTDWYRGEDDCDDDGGFCLFSGMWSGSHRRRVIRR